MLASLVLHAAAFAAFAATFSGVGSPAEPPAIVTAAAPSEIGSLDDLVPEPPLAFPVVAPPEEDPVAVEPDAPLESIEPDDWEFRDPRELLAGGPPTIGTGGMSGSFRRHDVARRGAPAAPHSPADAATRVPSAGPGIAPAPPAAVAVPTAGETHSARFAGPPSPPVYPEIARRRGWEGVVSLRIEIAADGSVRRVSVVRSSGRGPLDDSAVEAAATWHFEPARMNGTAVDDVIEKDVRFRLEP